MDILLYGDNFLKSQPIWSQYIQKPEIENFTLTHDFCRLKFLLVKISFSYLFYYHITKKWLNLLFSCTKNPFFDFRVLWVETQKLEKLDFFMMVTNSAWIWWHGSKTIIKSWFLYSRKINFHKSGTRVKFLISGFWRYWDQMGWVIRKLSPYNKMSKSCD